MTKMMGLVFSSLYQVQEAVEMCSCQEGSKYCYPSLCNVVSQSLQPHSLYIRWNPQV